MPGFFAGAPGDVLTSDASNVIVMTDKGHTVVTIAPNYRGPKKPFVFIVGVPAAITTRDVAFVPRDVVDRLVEADAPRLVELWERDPCAHGAPTLDAFGFGEGAGRWEGMSLADVGPLPTHLTPSDASISVVADVAALRALVAKEKLALPAGADAILASYTDLRFVVARVDPSKLVFDADGAALTPLRVHFAKPLGSLPFRLGALAIAPRTHADVLLHVLARDDRYDVGGGENTFLPEGADVAESARTSPSLFYSALLDRARLGRAAVTEYVDEAPHCRGCPSRPLDRADLATFGGDAIPGGNIALSSFRGSVSVFSSSPKGNLEGIEKSVADTITASTVDECVNEGSITVKLDALATGALANVVVVGSNLTDRRAEECVVQRIARMTLAQKPSVAETVSLTLGFRREWALDTPTWQLSRIRLLIDDKASAKDVTLRPAEKATRVVPKYVVRHPWTGAMACDVPQRDRWGTSDGTLATRYASHPIALANPIATTTPPLLEMFFAQPAETAPDAGVAVTGRSPLRSCGNCNVGHDGSAPWLAIVPAIALLVRRRRA